MRLDKFLKVSRLIKRRTVANEACDAGLCKRESFQSFGKGKSRRYNRNPVWDKDGQGRGARYSGDNKEGRSKRII